MVIKTKTITGLGIGLALTTAAALPAYLQEKTPATAGRPNILFAIADDAAHFSAYGYKFVNTPNFDRVAREGALFNNAFTSNPKCAPSRASILTGMHTWQLGEACNHFEFVKFPSPKQVKVYPNILEEHGYYIGTTGKPWGPGKFEKSEWQHNPAGPAFDQKKLTPPFNGMSETDYTGNFKDFLNSRPKGKPFYFWYGGMEPHRKYEPGSWKKAGKKLKDVVVPPYLPDNEVVRGDLLDYAIETEYFDQHLGMMLQELEKRGELDNTIVVVTSDNGMPFPRSKGQMYDYDFRLPLAIMWRGKLPAGKEISDLVSFLDFAPTFLEAAGISKDKQMQGKSLLELLKSKADSQAFQDAVYMGKERHDPGLPNDVGYPVRCIRTKDYLYVRNFFPERWPAGDPETGLANTDESPTKAVVMEQFARGNQKYYNLAFGKHPAEELYNIKKDPYCMKNLAAGAGYREIKNELAQKLEAKLKATNDPRILGQGDSFENYPPYTKTTYSWEKYTQTAGQSVIEPNLEQQKLWEDYLAVTGVKNPFGNGAKADTQLRAFRSGGIQVILDGKQQKFAVAPRLKNGEILVSSELLKGIDATVSLNQTANRIIVTKNNQKISFAIGKTTAMLDGREVKLTAAPISAKNVVLLPLKSVTEFLQVKYVWNESLQTAFIYVNQVPVDGEKSGKGRKKK